MSLQADIARAAAAHAACDENADPAHVVQEAIEAMHTRAAAARAMADLSIGDKKAEAGAEVGAEAGAARAMGALTINDEATAASVVIRGEPWAMGNGAEWDVMMAAAVKRDPEGMAAALARDDAAYQRGAVQAAREIDTYLTHACVKSACAIDALSPSLKREMLPFVRNALLGTRAANALVLLNRIARTDEETLEAAFSMKHVLTRVCQLWIADSYDDLPGAVLETFSAGNTTRTALVVETTITLGG